MEKHGAKGPRARPGSSSSPTLVAGPVAAAIDMSAPETRSSDDRAARTARARYRLFGLEPLVADEAVACWLAPEEKLLAKRTGVVLSHRPSGGPVAGSRDVTGDLYVTSDRLLLLQGCLVSFDLDDIEDAAISGDRILLVVRDGVGVALDAPSPRLLRVQISTARAARIGRRCQPSAR